MKKFKLEEKLKKVNNLVKSRMIPGIRIVMAMLRKYSVIKELFIHDFEAGEFMLIPPDLSQDHLPVSFRYYDPVILIIQENISYDRRYHLKMKKQIAVIFEKELSIQKRYKDLLYARGENIIIK